MSPVLRGELWCQALEAAEARDQQRGCIWASVPTCEGLRVERDERGTPYEASDYRVGVNQS